MCGVSRRYKRDGDTNQTLEFDLDPTGRLLLVGDKGGRARMYDTKTGEEGKGLSSKDGGGEEDDGEWDAVNGVGFSSIECNGVTGKLAVVTGERHYGGVPRGVGREESEGSKGSGEEEEEEEQEQEEEQEEVMDVDEDDSDTDDSEDDNDMQRGGKVIVFKFKYSSTT
ncbi:hypothetical protein TrRE_jg10639 [Triparma retinervis]|jgi:hypothetical protein|uniref:Uncharacterized protein n=1 Tax=Triparma retinervis TaxID=2557542 RepID=A0A9W6ZVG8_9STRA|nr:hypothetical protein TrRE_jg10639 [Triparma retinervis]